MTAPLLVLTDFSPDADLALRHAAALAALLKAPLRLLYVRRESLLDPEAFTGSIRHLSDAQIEAAFAERTAGLPVSVLSEAVSDRLPEALAAAVEQYAPALVVLGKPDTQQTPDQLVSTTALQLLRSTNTPLLVVPQSAGAPAPPRHLLLAVDGEPLDFATPPTGLRALLEELRPRFSSCHVASKATTTSVSAAETLTASPLLAGLGLPVTAHNMVDSDVPGAIVRAATELQADWLVLPARRRSFWGQLFNQSVTAQVLLHSPRPILLLPTS
ncbi:universal stress protein [Hymenobacter psychrophilus]|uniref:Nucleotide-binding universal stress protein, UspA family n=1 Tax=Hymenobacter psychrophilus TaxID=651662 RepID=A0A1H3IXI2_9BACT|nr:universal stress protein [Hymenobacter psychrophilus]SDY32463.1 Nucleotide-binding universal stress protein, UspA family [Hymenobacter psychrophilus]